jgi:hypothetical protein
LRQFGYIAQMTSELQPDVENIAAFRRNEAKSAVAFGDRIVTGTAHPFDSSGTIR